MPKVYLLLRNNKQAGPYTLEELVAQDIKQTDLIWVEGSSAAWRYPTEIKELQPYFGITSVDQKPTPPADEPYQPKTNKIEIQNSKSGKKVFVSLPFGVAPQAAPKPATPEDALEQKAEALRQRLQAYTPATEKPKAAADFETPYARNLHQAEAEYNQWKKEHRQKKSWLAQKPQLFAVMMVLIILAVPAYLLLKPATKSIHTVNVPATEITQKPEASFSVNADTQTAMPPTENFQQEPEIQRHPAASVTAKAPANSKPQKTVAADSAPVQENAIVQKETAQVIDTGTEAPVQNKAEPVAEKKKTIGEAIDGFFGKFKSKKKEEPPTANTTPDANGVRKANKREATTEQAAPNEEDLLQQVKVTANEPAENWMMGLKGLKLTIHNQSAYSLSKAAVEVSYFDEQNTLLDKKTVVFQNVPAHKNITLAAPDHRLASYAKLQLLKVSSE